MWIEHKEHIFEIWEVVLHLTKYLNPPLKNGIYPRTLPGKKEGERIEINSLYRGEEGGVINVLIFPLDKELYNKVTAILDDAITDNIFLHLSINTDQSEGYDHIRLDYEYTERTPREARLHRSRLTDKKF